MVLELSEGSHGDSLKLSQDKDNILKIWANLVQILLLLWKDKRNKVRSVLRSRLQDDFLLLSLIEHQSNRDPLS